MGSQTGWEGEREVGRHTGWEVEREVGRQTGWEGGGEAEREIRVGQVARKKQEIKCESLREK